MIQETTPDAAQALLTAAINFLPDEQGDNDYREWKRQFLTTMPYADITFFEPNEGMFILEAGDKATEQLYETGMLEEGAKAAYFPVEPGFIIIPKNFDENAAGTTKKRALAHEIHHVFRDQMRKAGVIAVPDHIDPKVWNEYNSFSNEMGGYLVSILP